MSFSVVLYCNNSENNAVTKDIALVLTATGTLKENCSIINPVIVLETSVTEIATANYCRIESFGRYYFITDIISLVNGLTQISCHVDVLMSFADQIKANTGIVRRQENSDSFNLYINDNSLVAYQNPYVLTEPFPSGFTGASFIMILAGGGS